MSIGAKRVLLTGANGFVGRQSIHALASRGYEVHALVFDPGGGTAVDLLPNEPGVRYTICDLMSDEQLDAAIEVARPSHLLHFAWETTNGQFWSSPRNLDWVSATCRLIRKFGASGGKRIVIAGTCAEYKWGGRAPLSELSTALEPSTLYGTCKNALRQITTAYAEQHGLSAAWGRIFFLYGPYEGASRFVSSAIISLLKGEPFHMSHGAQIRDFAHVEDVATAFAALLDSDVRGPVNIASGQPVSLREVAEIIGRVCDRPDLVKIGARPPQAGEPDYLVADLSLFRRSIGISPRFSLESGIRASVEWWRSSLFGRN